MPTASTWPSMCGKLRSSRAQQAEHRQDAEHRQEQHAAGATAGAPAEEARRTGRVPESDQGRPRSRWRRPAPRHGAARSRGPSAGTRAAVAIEPAPVKMRERAVRPAAARAAGPDDEGVALVGPAQSSPAPAAGSCAGAANCVARAGPGPRTAERSPESLRGASTRCGVPLSVRTLGRRRVVRGRVRRNGVGGRLRRDRVRGRLRRRGVDRRFRCGRGVRRGRLRGGRGVRRDDHVAVGGRRHLRDRRRRARREHRDADRRDEQLRESSSGEPACSGVRYGAWAVKQSRHVRPSPFLHFLGEERPC